MNHKPIQYFTTEGTLFMHEVWDSALFTSQAADTSSLLQLLVSGALPSPCLRGSIPAKTLVLPSNQLCGRSSLFCRTSAQVHVTLLTLRACLPYFLALVMVQSSARCMLMVAVHWACISLSNAHGPGASPIAWVTHSSLIFQIRYTNSDTRICHRF